MMRSKTADMTHIAIVDQNDALDAIQWCVEHDGFGSFQFEWAFSMSLYRVKGEFIFTDSRDHTLFSMLWV